MALICILLLVAISPVLMSCGSEKKDVETNLPEDSITKTVQGLSQGIKYYWKVVADDGFPGGTTESDVFNFTTVSTGSGGGKSWKGAVLLESDNFGDAHDPQVAMDNSGNGMAVWYQRNLFNGNAATHIWACRFSNGVGWDVPVLLESDDPKQAIYPSIAVDLSGNFIAVWSQWDGSQYSIYARRYISGSGWGTLSLIESNGSGNASYPRIAMDGYGNAIAVWQQADGGDFPFGTMKNTWACRFTVSGGWGVPQAIDTTAAGNSYPAWVAVDSYGNALVVWWRENGTTSNIWANRFSVSTGDWTGATKIEDPSRGAAEYPHVAINMHGDGIAVWTQYDISGTHHDILARKFNNGIGWDSAVMLVENMDGRANEPKVAIDSLGNAIAVWSQYDGTQDSIYFNRYSVDTTSWGGAFLLETDNTGFARAPNVAMIYGYQGPGNQDAVTVWNQFDGARINLWSCRYSPSLAWSVPETLENSDNSLELSYPIALSSNGNAIVIFTQLDGTRLSIWANRYE